MAVDKKISQLTSLAQVDVAASTDVLPIVDTSATETKKITVSALVGAGATAGLTNVDINSGTIDGTTIGASSASTGAFTTLSASGVATFSAGTAALPSLTTTGDTNTGIFFPAADTVGVTTGGSERLRVDSSGNVGIGGTASAFAKVHVLGTLPSSSNATQVFRASGEIPSGTTSTAEMFVTVPSTQAASYTLTHLRHYVAVQDTIGAGSTVTNQVGFRVSNTLTGATNNYGFYSDIASGTNRWNFYAAGTAQNYFAGNTLIGTTADLGSGARVNINSADGEADVLSLRYTSAAAGKHWRFAVDSNSTFYLWNQGGTGVYITDGATSWTGTSDERLKTDLKLIEDSVNKICQLRAVTGRFKTDEEGTSRSFLIAQDVQKVFPEAVSAINSDELGLRYTDMIPLLVAAIKEQQEQIKALQDKVAALEAK